LFLKKSEATMNNQCQHLMQSGQRCRAFAMRGEGLCYFHSNLNRMERAGARNLSMPFAPIQDLYGIQIALTQVFNLINNNYSETDRIGFFLRALELATQVAARIDSASASTCPRCGQTAGELPEPPDVDTSDQRNFLPNRIRTYPEPALIECSAVPASPHDRLPTPPPLAATPNPGTP
jgi:hypothetical protein